MGVVEITKYNTDIQYYNHMKIMSKLTESNAYVHIQDKQD